MAFGKLPTSHHAQFLFLANLKEINAGPQTLDSSIDALLM